jgi:predicted ATPase
MQTPYELVIRELIGIEDVEGPLEKELERLQSEGIELEGEPDGEHNVGGVYPVIDVEAEAGRMKEALRQSDIEKLRELVLVDRRTDTIVSHRDVGIGVSQVLPVLVAAYAYSNKILAMEQPEIHLHPALQSELADVFIASALGEQKNTFILETHSEHVMLRILRRIRETNEGELPEGMPPVRPEDVSVLYVSPTRSGATVTAIPIRKDGEFAERWPQGFFDERAKELF